MNPVAFNLFGMEIRWYGIIIAFAMILAVTIATKRAKNEGFYDDLIIDIAMWVIPFGIIGARLYYVAFEWENYAGDFYKIINIREGGLAIHGGLFLGILAGVIFTKVKKLDTWKIADIIAPVVPLAQAIGRWGNYMNGEAHGGETDLPWAILVDGVKVHPTFLYESLWNIGVFLLLLFFLEKRKKFDGELMCDYAILYSIGRFFIEGLRTDSLMFMGLRTAQLVSLSIVIIGVIIKIFYRSRAKIQNKTMKKPK